MASHVVLIDCPDQKGLVHKITGVFYRAGHNVTANAEFVDETTQHFFMRTEITGPMDAERIRAELQAELPAPLAVRITEQRAKSVVVLASREHHCLADLLVRNAYGELNAVVRAVVSNHDALADLARRFDVPFHFISHEGMLREEHERRVLAAVEQYQPEFLVLAKYMRLLTGDFVSRFAQRIVNIHHSFLPAFVGASPYRQAFQRGVKIIGATAHFVTAELDAGPIIAQGVVPVDHTHSATDMAEAGRDVEKLVLAQALRLVLEDRVFVSGNRTIIFD